MLNFYPRSPCGERHVINHSAHPHKSFLSTLSLRRATCMTHTQKFCVSIFLSTLSLRRATYWPCVPLVGRSDFYPRSPCGERPIPYFRGYIGGNISIHALLAESDFYPPKKPVKVSKFLSTLSLRRATPRPQPPKARVLYFYPRSPCGERPELLAA